jgi:FixJ family two-component response regulator
VSGAKVFLVDDDAKLRRALRRLLEAEGFEVESFGSAMEFLGRVTDNLFGCVVLDVSMPGVDGLELQRRLAKTDASLAIVFLTGHGDIPMSVRAMREGAWDFLTKPVKGGDLIVAVRAALERARARHASRRASEDLRERFAQLTGREREVLVEVIAGRLNKVIADRLGISEQTIKVHRGRVMEKLAVDSVAELVRAAHSLGIDPSSR